MNTSLWNPFQEFESLLDRYQKSNAGSLRDRANIDFNFADWAPSVDIEEAEDKYLIKADLPGVPREEIDVKLENGVLSIRGEKRTETESGSGKRHRTERFHGSFARSFSLPDSVDADNVDANYRDGVLTLAIPKVEKAKQRSIDIKVK